MSDEADDLHRFVAEHPWLKEMVERELADPENQGPFVTLAVLKRRIGRRMIEEDREALDILAKHDEDEG